MGNCRSSKTSAVIATDTNGSLYENTKDENHRINYNDGTSTSAFIDAMLPIILPVARRLLSKKLIEKGIVLLDEVPVPPVYDDSISDDELPLRPLLMKVDHVRVVDAASLRADMERHPEFGWPERDRAEQLMERVPGKDVGMVVLDLIQTDVHVRFAPGIEFVVPVQKMGMKVDLEIGSGGKITEGWVRFKGPLLRVWLVNETRKLYISFMECPDIIPHLNVNADRGKGDFASMYFTENTTSFDNVTEKVLSDFGPKKKKNKNEKNKATRKKEKEDKTKNTWLGEALAGLVISGLKKYTKVNPGQPLEIDMKNNIETSLSAAFGKPRPAGKIQSQIEALEKELVRAEQLEAITESQQKNKLVNATSCRAQVDTTEQPCLTANEKSDDTMGSFMGSNFFELPWLTC
uniref:Uncharacterized protein n=1 Tax=Attheya septentrionalis TaxID=420275 RepID=A0A7S2UBN4_9STRA|mmetsp:Transcript_1576/g.2824  ORF Transcript_1576/g.2824 Transcript_1576/m.2824 type:complete len:405 (+) Transcript_1576:62-1276(+)